MSTAQIAQTIAGLIQQQGADAARAREQIGAVYGGALRDTGAGFAGAIRPNPELQLAQQKVAEGQRQAADLKALDTAFSQPGGRDQILASVPGHLRPQISASFTAADEGAAKLQSAQIDAEKASSDYIATLAERVKAHAYDPSALQLSISHAKQTFASNPSILSQLGPMEAALHANPSPETVKGLVDPILAAKDAAEKPVILPATPRGGAPAQLVKPSSGVVTATGPAAPAQPLTEAEIAMQAAANNPAAAMALLKPPPRPEAAQTKSVLLDGKPSELTWEPQSKQWQDASGKAIDNAAARIKPIPPASATTLLPTGDALTMAAKRYLATGELPSMGMGQAGVASRIAVMNEAARIDPQASLAANAATFKADSANLRNLQTTEGSLSAFEKTAGKNLDQFLALAAKVPDTGVPWLNAPIRTVNAKGLGSADQAAFNAARDVALREIARVTNDPKLSGVLSDSARQEVSALSPATATFAQIKKVAQVLKQDMANVHGSLTDQIATVKGAIDTHPGAVSAGARVRVKGPNGETGTMPKGSALPQGWSLAP